MKTTFTPELSPTAKKDGTYAVYVRIYQDAKYRRVNLGFSIKKDDWNPVRKEVRKSNPNHRIYNTLIKKKTSEAELKQVVGQLTNNPTSITTLQLKLKNEITGGNFLVYANEYADRLKSSGSRRVYKTVIAKLSEYSPNLDFVDITREFLLNYKKWLEETKLNKQNTVHKNLTTIRTVYYEAVNSEKFEPKRNPFLSLKLKKERSNRVKLSEDELAILFKAELEVDSLLFHARNIFLFQYYAFGMRIADALQLKWLNVKDNRVDYIAQKTKKRHDVRLPKEALIILDYYKSLDRKPHSYVFPFLDSKLLKQATDDDKYRRLIESKTSQVNTNLKKLSVRVGINKNISTHVSRHSFAENARKKTGDIYAISKALGHSNISITEAYFAQEARNDTDRLSDLLFGE